MLCFFVPEFCCDGFLNDVCSSVVHGYYELMYVRKLNLFLYGMLFLFFLGLGLNATASVFSIDPEFTVNVVDVNESSVFQLHVRYFGGGVGFFVATTNSSGVGIYPGSFSLLSGQSGTVYVSVPAYPPGIYDTVIVFRELGSGENHSIIVRLAVASECVRASTLKGIVSLEADSGNISLVVNATGSTCVRLCVLPVNPLPEYVPVDKGSLGKYFDVKIGRPDHVSWPIMVKVNYTVNDITDKNLEELSLKLYYWNTTELKVLNNTGVDTGLKQVYAYPLEDETRGSIMMALAQTSIIPIPESPVTSLVLVLALASMVSLVYWRRTLD